MLPEDPDLFCSCPKALSEAFQVRPWTLLVNETNRSQPSADKAHPSFGMTPQYTQSTELSLMVPFMLVLESVRF
jgi:hypothetical protein